MSNTFVVACDHDISTLPYHPNISFALSDSKHQKVARLGQHVESVNDRKYLTQVLMGQMLSYKYICCGNKKAHVSTYFDSHS